MLSRIVSVRKNADMNQSEFAEKIGLTRNAITLIETGKRNPSDRTISDICREFNINEHWLRTGDGNPYMELEADNSISRAAALLGRRDPFLESFLEVYGKMSDSARSVMIDTLEEIIELYKSKKE